MEDVKVISQINNQDYLQIKPLGQSPSGHVLVSEDYTLIPNLYRTLKACLGKTKREVGKTQVNEDMTIIL